MPLSIEEEMSHFVRHETIKSLFGVSWEGVSPFQYKEIPHKKAFGTTLRVGSEGGLLTPSIGCHPEERSDEGSPPFN